MDESFVAPLWVNLATELPSLSLTVRATGADPAAAVEVGDGANSLTVVAGDTLTVTRNANGSCTTSAPAGSFSGGCDLDITWDGWEEDPTTALVLAGCQLNNWNLPTGPQMQPCTYDRGTMHVRPDNNTNTVNLSLELDMEAYVLGISESPYFWADTGGMAALQAQAVAARSYAYARMIDRGDPTDRPWCWCHVYDTPVDQNYVGWGHGAESWNEAVGSTAGIVMTHPEYEIGGVLRPIETFYSSSTYGYTEDSENAFITAVPYLRSVDDHWGGLPEAGNHNFRWHRVFSGDDLAARLPGLSTVTAVAITTCSNSGAALELTFEGSDGPRSFHVRELRGLLGIPSQQIIAVGEGGPAPAACPSPGDPSGDPATAEAEPAVCPPEVKIKALVKRANELDKGSVGKDVRQLNALLSALGYYDGFISKKFKKATKKAVKRFQVDNDLPKTGIVDDATRAALVEAHSVLERAGLVAVSVDLGPGSIGPDVSALQELLNGLGFDSGVADGHFGPMTAGAVRQLESTLERLQDGVFDSGDAAGMVALLGLPPFPDC